MEEKMLCYQCEQTAHPDGCSVAGNCGKNPRVSAMLDLVMQAVKGLSFFAHELAAIGEPADRELGRVALDALFTTVTNVNFDEARITDVLSRTVSARERSPRNAPAGNSARLQG